jgi:TetR/AcrR family transcriptional repressor of mexJK operon
MNVSATCTTAASPGRPKDPAKRRAILDAAKSLFLSNGYEGSSMAAIAAAAGVSKLTIYSHFTDKETLFTAAVKSKCEEQLPQLFFQLPADAPIERILLDIGRGFHQLVNSAEALELQRVMVAQANQDRTLSQLFLDAGPQRVVSEMQRLLGEAVASGQLRIQDTARAAGHFLNLIKGGNHFRLLLGCSTELQDEQAVEAHIQDVVALFMRAYRN